MLYTPAKEEEINSDFRFDEIIGLKNRDNPNQELTKQISCLSLATTVIDHKVLLNEMDIKEIIDNDDNDDNEEDVEMKDNHTDNMNNNNRNKRASNGQNDKRKKRNAKRKKKIGKKKNIHV